MGASRVLKNQVELDALNAHATAENILLAHYRQAGSQLGNRAIEQEQLLHDLKAAEEQIICSTSTNGRKARIGDALDQGAFSM